MGNRYSKMTDRTCSLVCGAGALFAGSVLIITHNNKEWKNPRKFCLFLSSSSPVFALSYDCYINTRTHGQKTPSTTDSSLLRPCFFFLLLQLLVCSFHHHSIVVLWAFNIFSVPYEHISKIVVSSSALTSHRIVINQRECRPTNKAKMMKKNICTCQRVYV